jgi:hypothetical protein
MQAIQDNAAIDQLKPDRLRDIDSRAQEQYQQPGLVVKIPGASQHSNSHIVSITRT